MKYCFIDIYNLYFTRSYKNKIILVTQNHLKKMSLRNFNAILAHSNNYGIGKNGKKQ